MNNKEIVTLASLVLSLKHLTDFEKGYIMGLGEGLAQVKKDD